MLKEIFYMVLVATLLVTGGGCGKSHNKGGGNAPKDTPHSVFKGQSDGWGECVQAFDELLCPPSYKDGLASGKTYKYYRYNNGKVMRLDENKTFPKGATPLEPRDDTNTTVGGE